LHETEKTADYRLLFIELLYDLLHLTVLSTLVILFILLSLLLCLRLSLHHVCLVLVLFKLVLNNAPLDIFKGLATSLLLRDAIIANHVNKHDASVHDLLFFIKEKLNALAELFSATFTISIHDLSQSNYE
jgi:hypothetical protein